ncbi:hypothetical protein V8C86DRAFT_1158234 [Haematococcus lacustris]
MQHGMQQAGDSMQHAASWDRHHCSKWRDMRIEYIDVHYCFSLTVWTGCKECANSLHFFCWPSSRIQVHTWYDIGLMRHYFSLFGGGVSMAGNAALRHVLMFMVRYPALPHPSQPCIAPPLPALPCPTPPPFSPAPPQPSPALPDPLPALRCPFPPCITLPHPIPALPHPLPALRCPSPPCPALSHPLPALPHPLPALRCPSPPCPALPHPLQPCPTPSQPCFAPPLPAQPCPTPSSPAPPPPSPALPCVTVHLLQCMSSSNSRL